MTIQLALAIRDFGLFANLKTANNELKLTFLAHFRFKIAVLVFKVEDLSRNPANSDETCSQFYQHFT